MRGFSQRTRLQVAELPPDSAVTDLAPPNAEARVALEEGGAGPVAVAAVAEPSDAPPAADAAVADVAAETADGGQDGEVAGAEVEVVPEPMAILGPVPAPPPAPPTETSIDFSKYDNATTPLPSILWNETNKTEWESVMGPADVTPEDAAMDAVQGQVLQEQLQAWLDAESDEAVRAKIQATLNASSDAEAAAAAAVAAAADGDAEDGDVFEPAVNVTTEPPPEIVPLPEVPTPEPLAEIEMRLQAAVDCAVGDWSTFEDCKAGRFDGARQWYTIRYRPVTNPQSYNGTHHGRPCLPLIERAPCQRQSRSSAATYR